MNKSILARAWNRDPRRVRELMNGERSGKK